MEDHGGGRAPPRAAASMEDDGSGRAPRAARAADARAPELRSKARPPRRGRNAPTSDAAAQHERAPLLRSGLDGAAPPPAKPPAPRAKARRRDALDFSRYVASCWLVGFHYYAALGLSLIHI